MSKHGTRRNVRKEREVSGLTRVSGFGSEQMSSGQKRGSGREQMSKLSRELLTTSHLSGVGSGNDFSAMDETAAVALRT